jgi:hypothetical protein
MNSVLGSVDFPSPRWRQFPGFYFRVQFFKHVGMVHVWGSLVFISKFARLGTCFISLVIGVDRKSFGRSDFNPRTIKVSSQGSTLQIGSWPIDEAYDERRSCDCGTNGEMKFKHIEWYLFPNNATQINFESSL